MPVAALGCADPALTQVLGRYLAVQSPPLVPELALWLVAGHVDLNARCQELLDGGYAPYWAFCWASGQALARYVLDQPELVRGKRVVDFGAGSGVAAIAARKAGAASVVAVDTDARARQFAALNAALNGETLATAERVPDAFDLRARVRRAVRAGRCERRPADLRSAGATCCSPTRIDRARPSSTSHRCARWKRARSRMSTTRSAARSSIGLLSTQRILSLNWVQLSGRIASVAEHDPLSARI